MDDIDKQVVTELSGPPLPDVTDSELAGMIADLMYTDDWPVRERLCIALNELRDLRRRWAMFEHAFPWLVRFMVWMSRKRRAPLTKE